MPKTLDAILAPVNIGNEAMGGTLYAQAKAIAEGFANHFNTTRFAEAGQRLSSMFAISPIDAHQIIVDNAICMWLQRINYIKLSVVQVYRPAGLLVTYGEYLDTLELALDFTIDMDKTLLTIVESSMMTYLNNPSMLTASAVTRSKNKYYDTTIDTFAVPIGECFDPTEKSDKYSFTEAFQRNSDYEAVVHRMGQLKRKADSVGHVAIQKRVTSIFEMVDRLAKLISENDNYKHMTKPMAKRLADDLVTCAAWVEFYAVLLRQISVLHAAIDDSTKHIKELSKTRKFG